ncbi:hypothetical protein [Paludifilum halophilum]|uniref:Uncharacterized protein n=1 Tax=Paludifilum halophilum TaxID=1642702 RepID=A0A235B1G6_9BACL|nr:hypothetical protein [Paludifilum halophilum]OYD06114.1 hypothetical protein CHM34_18010 [Paludifilum halophilum]
MDEIQPIRTEAEYEEILSRLRKGAEYIESPEFQMKSQEHKRVAMERYNQLSEQIMRYKGWI